MTPILGKSVATAEQMAAYLLSKNPNPKLDIEPLLFCRLYLLLGELEGVRGDLAFAQTCKETGNLAFTGTVTPDQKNYAGLGTTSTTVKGAYFPDEAVGILAQLQHLKAYDGTPLVCECVDPRYEVLASLGRLGTAKYWEELGGKWAVPGYSTKKYSSLEEANKAKDSYGYNVLDILESILAMPGGKAEEQPKEEIKEETKEPEQETSKEENKEPLKGIRICIDAGHYRDYNKCPGNPTYAEARVMWKLHLLQKQYLEALGATVILTRSNQELDLSLSARGKSAKGCHLFISDHSNAVGSYMNETVDYVAVYHLTEDAYATCDDISKEIANVLAPVIAGVMGTKQGYRVTTRKATSDKNGDGVLNDNYYGVLNGARSVDVPGMILEHSFHTNTAMVNWLLNDANLDKLARAEAEAIAKYFGGKDVEIESNNAGTGHVPYTIRVANVAVDDVLYIRKEPNYKSDATGKLKWNDPNRYTIVEESNGWGRLKSGIGWINLKFTVRA